jgi:hypothetical protein
MGRSVRQNERSPLGSGNRQFRVGAYGIRVPPLASAHEKATRRALQRVVRLRVDLRDETLPAYLVPAL